MTTRTKILLGVLVVIGAVIAPKLGVDTTQIGQAIIGALVVIAWLSQRAQTAEVHDAVNGKNDDLQAKVDALRAEVSALERELRVARGSTDAIEAPPAAAAH